MTEPAPSPAPRDQERIRSAVEIAIRLGVLAALAAWCLQIVAPFLGIIVWGLVIAVAATDPYERLVGLVGGRRGLATLAFVALGLLIVIVPVALLSETLIGGAQRFAEAVRSGQLHVPPPAEGVAEWPVIGERLDAFWRLASENLREALQPLRPQLESASLRLLSAAGSAGFGLLQIVGSLIVAGLLVHRGADRRTAIRRLAVRLAGPQGEALAELAGATVQSVVLGILGVAFVQAVLAGIGLMVVGIPGAGLWALFVLIAAVVQLPVGLVLLVPVLIGFSTETTAGAIGLAVWCLVISLLDNVLKPLLFGRGVRTPMLVIFLGAIGGMLSMGILGLFVGAVVLVLAYELLLAWLGVEPAPAESA